MVEKIKKEKRKKILVTGSSGMLGVNLCRELSSGYDVIGMDNRRLKEATFNLVAFTENDVTDKSGTLRSIADFKPDFIVHTAAFTDVDACEKDPEKAYRINTEGTQNVALSASELSIPLLYVSTDFIFKGNKNTPYKETDAPDPINIYGKSKLKGEEALKKVRPYIIVRTSWLYGKNGKNFVETILDLAEKKKDLKVVNDQVGVPTYTKDLSAAIHILIEKLLNNESKKDYREIFHITNKGAVSWFDYTKEILKIANIKGRTVSPIKSEELKRPARRPAFSVLDNSKFEKTTGFIMREWQEALSEYINDRS